MTSLYKKVLSPLILAAVFGVISCSNPVVYLAVLPSGTIITVAGRGGDCDVPTDPCGDGGDVLDAQFNGVGDVEFDAQGNMYIADIFDHRIRRVDGETGIVTTIAGTGNESYNGDDQPAIDADLNRPRELRRDPAGNLFFLDLANHRVRMIEAVTGMIRLVAGDGTVCADPPSGCGDGGQAVDAQLNRVHGLALDGNGNIFIAGFLTHRMNRIDRITGVITTIAGNGVPCADPLTPCGDGAPAVDSQVKSPSSGAFDNIGNYYFADAGNNRVRKIDVTTGIITTVAGNGEAGAGGDGGPATAAQVESPRALEFDPQGNLYIADAINDVIRKVDKNGIISTVAGMAGERGYQGDGGPGVLAELNQPFGLTYYAPTNSLYISSAGNHVVRRLQL